MSVEPVKVLRVSSHPVQYAAAQYRRYAADPRVDVTVAYCSLQGAEPGADPGFGVEVAWDVPLLDGYRWVHPKNRSPRPGLQRFWGLVNPGLWHLVRRERFDVVVCYGYRTASFWIAAAAAKASRAALVFTTDAHTVASRNGSEWKRLVKRALLPLIFSFADAVFAPSSRTVRFLESLGVRTQSVFLTPNVVDNAFFVGGAAAADRASVRARWGVPRDAFVALFVGQLQPWKRPGDLVAALARLPRAISAWAVFAGDGPLRVALASQAERAGISECVRFPGFVNQRGLPEVYAAADVLVLPSEYEAFGLVVNEAFCCWLPAIVSDACGSAGDLVRDGETGFVVPVGDVPALAACLERLAAEPGLRRRLGDAGRARIESWGPVQNAEAFASACLALAWRRKEAR